MCIRDRGKGVTAARLPDSVLRELQKVSARVMKEESAKDADLLKYGLLNKHS